MTPLKILRPFDTSDNHQYAKFFHLLALISVLELDFGHSYFYLFVERDGAIEGMLHLDRIKSLLFGDTLI